MTFHLKNGVCTVDDPDTGERVFDSAEKLFTGVLYAGSIALPARSATDGGGARNVNTDWLLANCPPEFDTVVGAFKVVTSGEQGASNIGWFAATGTYMHYQGATGAFGRVGKFDDMSQIAGYTFFASGGGVYLNERVHLVAESNRSITLLAPTFHYRLYAGTFI